MPVTIAVHAAAATPLVLFESIVGSGSQEMPVSFLIAGFAAQLIWLAGLWPMLAVASKRSHDRNKRGGWLLVWWLLPFCLFFGGFGLDFTDRNPVRSADVTTGMIMMLASLPIALWGLVELGILPGTKGVNRFGDDPQPPRA